MEETKKDADEENIPPGGKRGWPRKYTPELAREICDRLADGETLIAICRREGMPAARTVRQWALDDIFGFSAQYAQARELQAHCLADLVLERAGHNAGEYMDEQGCVRMDNSRVNRDRLFCDTIKWYLSKILPKVYGEKIEQKVSHSGGIIVRWADAPAQDDQEASK